MLEPASYEDLHLHPYVKCGDRERERELHTDDALFPERGVEALLRAVFNGKNVLSQNFSHLAQLVALSYYITCD